jgi:hypothetical protein
MVLRIEKRSIVVTPTSSPEVVRVDADVTNDPIEVVPPNMEHVSVLWNTTTPRSELKEAMRKALRDNSFQDTLREQIGEDIVAVDTTPGTPPDYTIQANNVTVVNGGGA